MSFLSSLPVTMATCQQPVRASCSLFPFLSRWQTLTEPSRDTRAKIHSRLFPPPRSPQIHLEWKNIHTDTVLNVRAQKCPICTDDEVSARGFLNCALKKRPLHNGNGSMTTAAVTELIIWQFSRMDGHVITCKRPIKQPLARPAHSCACP